jgi:predicted RNase H-like nuclease (RuvC/YqgF family)
MSQRDGFASGFLAGAIFGGVVGGVLGTLITRRETELIAEDEPQLTQAADAKKASAKRRQMRASESDGMEMETARRSLEDKIAQLNATIDEVRQQLGNVNSNSGQASSDRTVTKDS